MSQPEAIKFNNSLDKDFTTTLNKRVNNYFKERGIDRHANAEMVVKTIFMLSLYFIPYGILVSGVITNLWVMYLTYFITGFGVAGIGLSIMHDANHGAYSKNKWVNKLLGYTLNLVGGNATNWKIQHNMMHHTYTNISSHDEDVAPKPILRFSPKNKLLAMHKYQYIYAWFLYGFMTISWIAVKDIRQLMGYSKSGILNKVSPPLKAWPWMLFTKIFYFSYAMVLPMFILPFAWWQVFLGFLLMHYVAGFILGIIFQPAHVMEETDFPEPTLEGKVENNWIVHQLYTTCNFAHKNRIFSWYVGGLNYQVEHHIFPNICHVHYRDLSKIVKETAQEFDLPYLSVPTFSGALKSHGRMLYKLGRPTPVPSNQRVRREKHPVPGHPRTRRHGGNPGVGSAHQ
jgi:linoleoyl-CoA desaturase